MSARWTAEDYSRPEFWAEHCKWTGAQLAKVYGMSERTWRDRAKAARELYNYLPWKESYAEPVPGTTEAGVDLNALKRLIKNEHKTVGQLADFFDVSPRTIRTALELLKTEHIMVECTDDWATINTEVRHHDPIVIDNTKYGERTFAIGAIADTHLGSKYERLDVLESLYDRFEEAGVTDVYHGGNWIDGEARFNKQDIYVHGMGGMVSNFVNKYPRREGMKTHIISGDDHEGWYVQREGINIGKYMESMAREIGRTDLIDLGYIERDIEFKAASGSAILRVAHMGGGSTYAHSYTAQKYTESLQGGEKPKIVIAGHYHKFNYSYPREVHVIQPGAVQDQTPFMRKKKIQSMVGGCILWITQNDLGIITGVRVEWFPFYNQEFYEYKW